MTYHILNGDSLGYTFPQARIPGQVIIFREALIAGPLDGETLEDFWTTRAKYIKRGKNEYQSMVLDELEKIMDSKEGDEFHLWFEYDLFCQVNMWFVCSLLSLVPHKKKVFAVYTTHLEQGHKFFWNGFGPATAEELRECFKHRISITEKDLALGHLLWQAIRNKDKNSLRQLAKQKTEAFPYLKEVLEAHLDTDRPARVIEEILNNGPGGFDYVFSEFWKQESIYGFGDLQLKEIYDAVMKKRKRR